MTQTTHTVQMSGYQITATEEVLNSLSIFLEEVGSVG